MATTPHVLVIDDFSEAAKLLGCLLNRIGGFQTRAVTDGFEAIRIAEEFRPDFVSWIPVCRISTGLRQQNAS